ncbi:hypothetical protein PS906_05148 [Pseudomonas fluorescens]|nr:hypothetical protein PS906_05148 [Pseudomonas fluorescens]
MSITGDQEYSTTLLGDSEILSIKHSPKSHVPAVRKGPDDCFKVVAIVDSEQVNDVFKHHPARLYFFEDSYDFPKQSAAFAAQSADVSVAFSGAGDADVLAGESSGEDVDRAEVVGATVAHVFKLLCAGKSIGKHSPVDGVEFDLPGAAVSRVFKSDIKASYACEQAAKGGLLHS